MGDADDGLDLGPLYVREPLGHARLRFHQAWYRSEVLRLRRYGSLPRPHERPLGSVLHKLDARADRNFTSDHASQLYHRRHAEGWGVDPSRCLSVMTSSQALSLNVFGPLVADLGWCGRTFAEALAMPPDSVEVDELMVEFAPARRSLHLGDMTRIDLCGRMFIGGEQRILAIEVKLTDRYVSRVVRLGDRYARLIDESDLWRDDALTRVTRQTNQLFRVHALATSVGREQGLFSTPLLMLLHHPMDRDAGPVAAAYRSTLKDRRSLRAVSLDSFIAAMRNSAACEGQRSLVDVLVKRYVDLSGSEPHWLKRQLPSS